MSDKQPVISVHGLAMETRPQAWQPTGAAAEKFHVERAPLTERLGLTTLGINATRVAPGKTAYPFHSHRCNDELFYVLSGSGELRLGDARHAVKAGDVIEYPDSKKIGVWSGEFSYLTRGDKAVDCWDGE